MRTKIEYSVDLKEVPAKIKEKFLDITEELRRLSSYVEALRSDLEYDNVAIMTSRIERARRCLYSVDNALEDCEKTIRGYAATVAQLQEQQAKMEEVANETDGGDDD
jgi:prefoldin subunit 5